MLALATQAAAEGRAPAATAAAPRGMIGTGRIAAFAGRAPTGRVLARGARYAQGDIAAPGVDLGLDLATGLAGAGVPFAPDAVPPYGPPWDTPPPTIVPPYGPPPCIRSKIIQVGRGLRHAAKTKVIYGAPAC